MTKEDKKFKRKCIICGKYFPKSDLIRFTKNKDGSELFVNTNSDVFGRSIYICKDEKCLNKSLKPNVLSKYTKLNHLENVIKYISQMIKYKNT